MTIDQKMLKLRRILRGTGGLAVAFSGGVDSTFLVAVAKEELGDRLLALTAVSPTYPAGERNEAVKIASLLGVKQVVVRSNELRIPGFAANPPDRCYHCKSELFRILKKAARRRGIAKIADGANADDTKDYRPGRRAAGEAGVMSPLLEAGLGKAEIRRLSRRMNLPTADKPAYACLASRFPYGSRITAQKLKAVDAVEQGIRTLGFRQVRARHHGDLVRIEVGPDEVKGFFRRGTRQKVVKLARSAGFAYVSVDLQGYRTGSMNETLTAGRRAGY